MPDIDTALQELSAALADARQSLGSAQSGLAAARSETDAVHRTVLEIEAQVEATKSLDADVESREEAVFFAADRYADGVAETTEALGEDGALAEDTVTTLAADVRTALGVDEAGLAALYDEIDAYDDATSQLLADSGQEVIDAREVLDEAREAMADAWSELQDVEESILNVAAEATALGAAAEASLDAARAALEAAEPEVAAIHLRDLERARERLLAQLDLAADQYDVVLGADPVTRLRDAWTAARTQYEESVADVASAQLETLEAELGLATSTAMAVLRESDRLVDLAEELAGGDDGGGGDDDDDE